MEVGERDPVTGRMTTGHEWNGIKELNTPVPRVVIFFLVVDDPVRGRILDPHACLAAGLDLHEGAARDRPENEVERQVEEARAERAAWTQQIDADGLRGDPGRPGADGRSCARPDARCSATIARSATGRAAPAARVSRPHRRRLAVGRRPRDDRRDHARRHQFDA